MISNLKTFLKSSALIFFVFINLPVLTVGSSNQQKSGDWVNSLGMKMKKISSGGFRMGT